MPMAGSKLKAQNTNATSTRKSKVRRGLSASSQKLLAIWKTNNAEQASTTLSGGTLLEFIVFN